MDERSKGARILRLRAWIAAIPKRMGKLGVVTLGSKPYTAATLVQPFQEELDALLAIDSTKAAHDAAIADERAVKKRNRPLNRNFEKWLQAAFHGDVVVLGDFSLEPIKPRKVAIKTRAESAAKATATRKRRAAAAK